MKRVKSRKKARGRETERGEYSNHSLLTLTIGAGESVRQNSPIESLCRGRGIQVRPLKLCTSLEQRGGLSRTSNSVKHRQGLGPFSSTLSALTEYFQRPEKEIRQVLMSGFCTFMV